MHASPPDLSSPALISPALRDTAERYLASHPPPGQLILCAVTGSHIYGFPSPDSDIDLKGIHQAPTERLLSLFPGREDHDCTHIFEGVECDLTTHELAQALRLVIKGNGNMLERIFSPIQLVDTPALHALQQLTLGSLSRASAGHYRGYLKGMRREHNRAPTAKTLLYCVRVALTGVCLLEDGVVESNLNELAPRYGWHDALELAAYKRATGEKIKPPAALARSIEDRIQTLDDRLTEAFERSPLPRSAPNVAELDAWLVAQRL